jgi:hypothetical protein
MAARHALILVMAVLRVLFSFLTLTLEVPLQRYVRLSLSLQRFTRLSYLLQRCALDLSIADLCALGLSICATCMRFASALQHYACLNLLKSIATLCALNLSITALYALHLLIAALCALNWPIYWQRFTRLGLSIEGLSCFSYPMMMLYNNA